MKPAELFGKLRDIVIVMGIRCPGGVHHSSATGSPPSVAVRGVWSRCKNMSLLYVRKPEVKLDIGSREQ